uniref:Dihydrolipoyl dehydrogenase n=1 Tax=Dictyoglomus thermophilum TaxID=14 RepID=A0A7C3MMN4_DICTH
MEKYDVIFLGGGSGGYVGAIRAADLGKKVCVIEERDLGGTCLNRGCIPTKALLKSAEIYNSIKEGHILGIKVDSFGYDVNGIYDWKENVVKKLVTGIEYLFKSRKITLKKGKGKILDNTTVEVETKEGKELIKGDNIVIATGSEPAIIPSFKIDGVNVLTSDDALRLREIPKDILIVGAGAIGIEFANFYNAFGSKVTIVEMMPQVVPTLKDKKIAALLQRILSKKGIEIKTGAKIENIEVKDSKVYSTLSTGETIESEKVLVSIGRKLNSDNIGLENVGINTEKGRIVVNEYLRTNVDNIYAIGDVIGGLLLAHKAMKEGEVVAEIIAGEEKKMDYRVLPWAIFSNPEIAVCGLTEEEAKEQGMEVLIGEFPFTANGKAVTMNATDGLVKVVARKEDKVLIGAQIVGPEASVMIAELALAIKNNLTLDDVADTIHTHPTLPEAIMEAVKVPLGSVVHIALRR